MYPILTIIADLRFGGLVDIDLFFLIAQELPKSIMSTYGGLPLVK